MKQDKLPYIKYLQHLNVNRATATELIDYGLIRGAWREQLQLHVLLSGNDVITKHVITRIIAGSRVGV
jgi:hypothetical protein